MDGNAPVAPDHAPVADDADHRLVDRFSILLVVTAASVVVQSLIDVSDNSINRRALLGNLVVTLLVGATMVLALRTGGLGRRRRRGPELVIIGIVALLVLTLLLSFLGNVSFEEAQSSPPYFWLLLSVVAPVVVVRRLLHHRTVTVQTLFGALAAYLLLAITFGFAFQTVDAVQATPFFGDPQPTTSYIYYSLVTVTTVGYGTLTAATPLGRLLSVSAAVVGQVYLVTVVAMFVGLLAQRRAR